MHGFFGGYLVWASTQENFIFSLKPKFSAYLGNVSYAMYVNHVVVISFVISF
jgi:peptidoglycan/LPS O-acetylase OafA/YrhL